MTMNGVNAIVRITGRLWRFWRCPRCRELGAIQRWVRFKAPKTDRARAITLPSFSVEELNGLKREQAEELLALGIRQTGDTQGHPALAIPWSTAQ